MTSTAVTENTDAASDLDDMFDNLPVVIATPKEVAEAKKSVARSTMTWNKHTLYFDLETVPDLERKELFGLEEIPALKVRTIMDDGAAEVGVEGCLFASKTLEKTLDGVKAHLLEVNPSNIVLDEIDAQEKVKSKPRKGVFEITAELRKQDQARDDMIAEQRKKMSVTPEMCRIVAMGFCLGGETRSLVVGELLNTDDFGNKRLATESDILELFWALAHKAKHVCGFNIIGFDLLVIFIRSMLLDIAPTRGFDTRPWGTDLIDLMVKRFPKTGTMGLKKVCKMMGIEVPAGDMDGSKVEETWREDPSKVGEYVRSDVDICIDLHTKYRGFFC